MISHNLLVGWCFYFVKNAFPRNPKIRNYGDNFVSSLDVIKIAVTWMRRYNNFFIHFLRRISALERSKSSRVEGVTQVEVTNVAIVTDF